MSDFDRSVFWPELKAAGMLRAVVVKQSGKPAVNVDVKYAQPTERRFDGSASSQEHSIKYQHADLPYLAEGDLVSFLDDAGAVIRAERFRVRECPLVSALPGDDQSGYFRHAVLTRIA